MKIVFASKGDREAVMELYKMQLGREFCFWDEDYPSYEILDYDIERNNLIVMKDGGRVIATISVDEDENVEELDLWSKALKPGKELARLSVHPSMHNKGIARSMLEFGMNILKERGYKSVHFLVNKGNKKAISSYSHLGFDIVGECNLYDQDFLCYEKELIMNG